MNTDDLAQALIDSELIVRYIEYARKAHPDTMIDEPIEMTAHVWAAALNPFLGGPSWEQACRWRHAQTCDWERGGTSCSCGLLAFQVPLAVTPTCRHSGPGILPTDNFCADCGAALAATPPASAERDAEAEAAAPDALLREALERLAAYHITHVNSHGNVDPTCEVCIALQPLLKIVAAEDRAALAATPPASAEHVYQGQQFCSCGWIARDPIVNWKAQWEAHRDSATPPASALPELVHPYEPDCACGRPESDAIHALPSDYPFNPETGEDWPAKATIDITPGPPPEGVYLTPDAWTLYCKTSCGCDGRILASECSGRANNEGGCSRCL